MKKIVYIIVLLIGFIGNSQTPFPTGIRLPNATKSDTLSTQTRLPIMRANSGNLINGYVPVDSLSAYLDLDKMVETANSKILTAAERALISGAVQTETDPVYNAWDKDYDDLINKPTIPSAPTGLEAINEGNGIGWRLIGRNPANYGNIGLEAIDFSTSLTASTTFGARGYGSVAFGEDNIASGVYSFVSGTLNSATGYASTAFGYGNNVNDHYSFSTGALNTISNRFSTALGFGLIAKDYGTTVVGFPNTDYTASGSINDGNNRLLIVGNGNFGAGTPGTVSTRSDAFVAFKSGVLTAPSLTEALIEADTTGRVLTTKEFVLGKIAEGGGGSGDYSEWATYSGTRAGSNLYLRIGDYDNSGNGTRITMDDSVNSINFFGFGVFNNNMGIWSGSDMATFKADNLTTSVNIQIPNIGTTQRTAPISVNGNYADTSGNIIVDSGGGSDDQTAAEVPFTPYSTIAATNVQNAIQEVVDEIPTSLAAANITVSPSIAGETDAYAVMEKNRTSIDSIQANFPNSAMPIEQKLSNWFYQLENNPSTATMAFVGDSTSDLEGNAGSMLNTVSANSKPGFPLEGFDTANMPNYGSNGQTIVGFISDAGTKGLAAVAAANLDLVIFSFGINDIRLNNLTKDQLKNHIITCINTIQSGSPDTDIVLRMPNSFDIPSDDFYIKQGGYASLAEAAQAHTDILYAAYKELEFYWDDVVLFNTQDLLFGRTSAPEVSYLHTDEIHPRYTEMINLLANDFIGIKGNFTKEAAERAIATSSTPWASYPKVFEKEPEYIKLGEGTINSQSGGNMFITVPENDAYRVNQEYRYGDYISINDGEMVIRNVNGLAFNDVNRVYYGGTVPTNSFPNGTKVEFFRARYNNQLINLRYQNDKNSYPYARRVRISGASGYFEVHTILDDNIITPITKGLTPVLLNMKPTDVVVFEDGTELTLTGATFSDVSNRKRVTITGDYTAYNNTVAFIYANKDYESFVDAEIQIACSDLTTDITTGNSKCYFRMPYNMNLTSVRVSLLTAGTTTGITADINENGTTVLSTKLTTDATEKTSTTATTAAVISDAFLADDSEITVDFDAVPTGGKGVIMTLKGKKY